MSSCSECRQRRLGHISEQSVTRHLSRTTSESPLCWEMQAANDPVSGYLERLLIAMYKVQGVMRFLSNNWINDLFTKTELEIEKCHISLYLFAQWKVPYADTVGVKVQFCGSDRGQHIGCLVV